MSSFLRKAQKAARIVEQIAPFISNAYVDDQDSMNRSSQLTGEVLLQLGDYKFSVGTAAHQKISRKFDYRWAQIDRLGRKPAQQFIGPGAESVTLDGYLYPHFAGGYNQIGEMRAEAELGEPLMLVDQFGNILGQYCITSIEETGSILDHTGSPRRIDFSLTLVEYGEDMA